MSMTIAVRFLTGYCVAARSKTDPRPEWPPHPEKLFLALAAAYFEWDCDAAERTALQWLESLAPPTIRFTDRAMLNEAVATFVPANDPKSVGQGGTIQTIPSLKRHRAERMFPRTHLPPDRDTVYFTWAADEVESTRHRAALTGLCSRIGRFGNSWSLVQSYLADPQEVSTELTLEHEERAPTSLMRVVAQATGTLERLKRDDATPYRSSRSLWAGYAPPKPPPAPNAATTVFSQHLSIYRLQRSDSAYRQLDVVAAPQLCQLFRDAVLSHTGRTIAAISGHLPDGRPADCPHVAFAALPFVDQSVPHADGHILGLAVAVPRGMSDDEQHQLTTALEEIADELWGEKHGEGLHNDRLGRWSLQPADPTEAGARALDPTVWTAGSAGGRHWATVTPIALDRHSAARSKQAYRDECVAIICDSARAVLSDKKIPITVELTDISPFLGAPSPAEFPRLRRKDGTDRRQLHAVIHFGAPVVGPLLIGAGRYRGYGLCRPIREGW